MSESAPEGLRALTTAVRRNQIDAGVRLDSIPCDFSENVVVGPEAGICLNRGDCERTLIRGNFVSNTSAADREKSDCLHSDNPSAVVTDNIFRGGRQCIRDGVRTMTGNVMVGTNWGPGRPTPDRRTSVLVGSLPMGARFSENILIGPATTLLAPAPRFSRDDAGEHGTGMLVANNTLDGVDACERLLLIPDQSAPDVSAIALRGNCFLRSPRLLVNMSLTPPRMMVQDNVAAPRPRWITMGRGFAASQPSGRDAHPESVNWESGVRCHVLDEVLARPAPGLDFSDLERRIIAGELSIEAAREVVRRSYLPKPGGPLIVRENGEKRTGPHKWIGAVPPGR